MQITITGKQVQEALNLWKVMVLPLVFIMEAIATGRREELAQLDEDVRAGRKLVSLR